MTYFLANKRFQILMPIILCIIFFTCLTWVQFGAKIMPGNDSYYHIKMAYLMRTEGLKPAFPWLPLTILNEKDFYDHHFLYHVALIPFTFGDLLTGTKWSAVVFASLAFMAVWFLLYAQNVPLAWLWTLGLLGISEAFLYRMSMGRAQSLSLGILALGILWMLEKKYWHLASLGFVYVWTYDAFPLIIVVGGLHLMAVAIIERRFEWRTMAFILLGVALGIIINPYFPVNIVFIIRHLLPKLTEATSTNVGGEWFPYKTDQLLKLSLPSLIAFASGVLALGISGRKMDTRTALGFFTTLLFGYMLFQSRRFVEYFPAFALIFAALAWSPILAELQPDNLKKGGTYLLQYLPQLILGIFVVASTIQALPMTRGDLTSGDPHYYYQGASEWLAQNTPEGSRVFQLDWDDFTHLFYYNTHNTYLVGLDPTYMQIYDPGLYDLWVKITDGDVDRPAYTILDKFGCRYIYSDLHHTDFINVAEQDPNLKQVYRDDNSILFQVTLP